MGLSRGILSCLAGAACLQAEPSPVVEKNILFTSGKGGYACYRIPAIVVTPQQSALVACEARKLNRNDWGLIELVLRRSTDGGATWEPPRLLVGQSDLPAGFARNSVNPEPDGFTINNPAWVAEATRGSTHLLYCGEYSRAFIISSNDGGITFTAPREITSTFETFRTRDHYPWKVIATGPGHGVQLTDGRLVVPVWLSTSNGGNAHSPSVVATIYSDDGGDTWQAGAIVSDKVSELAHSSEPAVVEAGPRKVLLNIRNNSPRNRRAVAFSSDGATNWSAPQFAETLWEPVCMASLVRLSSGVLVFSNPASLTPPPGRPESVNRQRRNLSLRTSHDQGATWSDPFVIEPGPSAYSDLAVTADGTVLCFYEHSQKTPYEFMSIARIPTDALPKPLP